MYTASLAWLQCSTGETQLFQYFNTVFLEILNAPLRTVFADAVTFDPLGLLAPITFIGKASGKVFVQKLWTFNQSWDEPLSGDLQESWNHIVATYIYTDFPGKNTPFFWGFM